MNEHLNGQLIKKFIIVKGRFKSPVSNLYGIFILVLNNYKKFETYQILVSTFSELYETGLELQWNEIEDIIINQKWKGSYNKTITASMMDQIKGIADDSRLSSLLFDNADSDDDHQHLKVSLFDLINRGIQDKNMTLEVKIEKYSIDEFNEMKENRGKNENEEEPVTIPPDKEKYNLGDEDQIVNVKPILSPVKGKPVYDLKIGDKVMVKITKDSPKAEFIINLLELKDGDVILPVSASIVDIKAGSGKNEPVVILTLLSRGIYGKIIEEEKHVKVRLYNPQTDGKQPSIRKEQTMKKPSGKSGNDEGISKGAVVLMALIIFFLILFIFLIMILW